MPDVREVSSPCSSLKPTVQDYRLDLVCHLVSVEEIAADEGNNKRGSLCWDLQNPPTPTIITHCIRLHGFIFVTVSIVLSLAEFNIFRRLILVFVYQPGASGAREGAEPSDEYIWRTANGGVQGRDVQRRRSVRSCRDSTLPGALQLCGTHKSCGGKRTATVIYFLILSLSEVCFGFVLNTPSCCLCVKASVVHLKFWWLPNMKKNLSDRKWKHVQCFGAQAALIE